jgi:catechol 2,3-dioxygenase-like lactoylglutathione lyase family enzyme
MIKRLHSTLFYANDLAKTADFYERCGFPVERADDGVRVKMNSFTLAFINEHRTPIKLKASDVPKGLGIYTYAEVDDVDAHYAELKKKGIDPSSEPTDWPWGKREFVVKDPDGYRVVFYAPVKK